MILAILWEKKEEIQLTFSLVNHIVVRKKGPVDQDILTTLYKI